MLTVKLTILTVLAEGIKRQIPVLKSSADSNVGKFCCRIRLYYVGKDTN